ncbi:PREDICTED: endonuclease 2 isoform X1 [Nicotiana attenuata]|uniref:Aspergillus nuclease S1 n=1 Tax=Nicotiana attenuata TaxID=49451 RepID=A0A1J6HTU3_NICAT|nr:PREDICTED: endonuclease 2 isoform X1 [Nicotiana attenuata]OIS95763.1 endonuclease 2 [Nicotiana attenuata]
MEYSKLNVLLPIVAFLFLFPVVHGWGLDGHYTVCKIAQSRLSKAAADAVEKLLPASANGDLASVCIWADHVKFRYHWSSALHYIDTPDNLCNYQYNRDCKDENGVPDRCVAGAINNYTEQLLSYNSANENAITYNLTESLLFLSHFMGDIHQPLHVGFTSDRGANTIDVHWYTRKTVLHHVWDSNIIETAEERYDDSNVDELVDALQKNISTGWADQVKSWESCSGNKKTCPDIYATEGIKAACAWAYKGVSEGSTLEDDYFLTRFPIVQQRLAQGGVRLAATLNRIFT